VLSWEISIVFYLVAAVALVEELRTEMDRVAPRVGYGGIVGRVIAIWWVRAQSCRFAITIEEDHLRMSFWVLWYYWNRAWVYRVFLEEQESEVAFWFLVSGQVEIVAVLRIGGCT